MSNLDKYNTIFMETFDVEKSALDENFTFQSVGNWDSIAHMTLTAALEDTFDIMLDTDDILTFGSYENGKKILIKYGVEL